jgi:hypothetical protein
MGRHKVSPGSVEEEPVSGPLRTYLGLALLAACRTVEHTTYFPAGPSAAQRAMPTRAWSVVADDEVVIGRVVQFESSSGTDLYVVQDSWSQDLGLIDELGRAWRYVPHYGEPDWVGSGTIGQGAERILRARGPCRLRALELPERSSPDRSIRADP